MICSDLLSFPNTDNNQIVVITDVEWKNGSAVSGNVIAGILSNREIFGGSKPSVGAGGAVVLGQTGAIAQAGIGAVQKVKLANPVFIKGGQNVLGFLHVGNATSRARFKAVAAGTGNYLTIAFPSDQENYALNSNWTSSTIEIYFKIYYRIIEVSV